MGVKVSVHIGCEHGCAHGCESGRVHGCENGEMGVYMGSLPVEGVRVDVRGVQTCMSHRGQPQPKSNQMPNTHNNRCLYQVARHHMLNGSAKKNEEKKTKPNGHEPGPSPIASERTFRRQGGARTHAWHMRCVSHEDVQPGCRTRNGPKCCTHRQHQALGGG